MKEQLYLYLVAVMLVATGCQQEQPETQLYRQAAEQLTVENQRLTQTADASARMMSVASIALVITGGALAASLFCHMTRRRNPDG